jgi:hypothetical protein
MHMHLHGPIRSSDAARLRPNRIAACTYARTPHPVRQVHTKTRANCTRLGSAPMLSVAVETTK